MPDVYRDHDTILKAIESTDARIAKLVPELTQLRALRGSLAARLAEGGVLAPVGPGEDLPGDSAVGEKVARAWLDWIDGVGPRPDPGSLTPPLTPIGSPELVERMRERFE